MGMFVSMGCLTLSSLINFILLLGLVLQKHCVQSLYLKRQRNREMSVLPLHLQFWGFWYVAPLFLSGQARMTTFGYEFFLVGKNLEKSKNPFEDHFKCEFLTYYSLNFIYIARQGLLSSCPLFCVLYLRAQRSFRRRPCGLADVLAINLEDVLRTQAELIL